jgi:hypothetical protein
VLIIDPAANTADFTSLTGVGAGGGAWAGGELAPNGKIYAIPYADTGVMIVDPRSNGSSCGAINQSEYLNKL